MGDHMTVCASDARPVVMEAFSKVSTDAVQRFRDSVEMGELDGISYPTCIFGLLARSEDPSLNPTNMDFLGPLQRFWLSKGILLNPDALNAAEHFVQHVARGMTMESSPEVAQVVLWCDEELARRELEETQDELEFLGNLVSV